MADAHDVPGPGLETADARDAVAISLREGGRKGDQPPARDPNRFPQRNSRCDHGREGCFRVHLIPHQLVFDDGEIVELRDGELNVLTRAGPFNLHARERQHDIWPALRILHRGGGGVAGVRDSGEKPGRARPVDHDQVVLPRTEVGAEVVHELEGGGEVLGLPDETHNLFPVRELDELLREAEVPSDAVESDDESAH